jgi:hypothetical protein
VRKEPRRSQGIAAQSPTRKGQLRSRAEGRRLGNFCLGTRGFAASDEKYAGSKSVADLRRACVDVVKAVVAHRGVLPIAPARWIDFIAFTYTDATRSLTRRHPTGTQKRC